MNLCNQHTSNAITDPAAYAGRLRAIMANVSPASSRPTPPIPTYVSADCSAHMCLSEGTQSLQPPYDGPFRVILRTPKYYQLEMRGKVDTVSVDRLKLAHRDMQPPAGLMPPQPAPLAQPSPTPTATAAMPPSASSLPLKPQPEQPSVPPVFTRVGQQVRFPKHLQDYVY